MGDSVLCSVVLLGKLVPNREGEVHAGDQREITLWSLFSRPHRPLQANSGSKKPYHLCPSPEIRSKSYTFFFWGVSYGFLPVGHAFLTSTVLHGF